MDRKLGSYQQVMGKVAKYAPNAVLHVLLHKTDLIPASQLDSILAWHRQKILHCAAMSNFPPADSTSCSDRQPSGNSNTPQNAKSQFNSAVNPNVQYSWAEARITFHSTSIWNESLFSAWSAIVRSIMTNLPETFSLYSSLMEKHHDHLMKICIFDKKSMLFLYSLPSSTSAEDLNQLANILKHSKQQIKRDYKTVTWKNANFIHSITCIREEYLRLATVTNTVEGQNILRTLS